MGRLLCLFAVCLSAATPLNAAPAEPPAAAASAPDADEAMRRQASYYFQHKLLPKWTFEAEGRFFEDLLNGRTEQLRNTALMLLAQTQAQLLEIRPLPEQQAVLIVFPPPQHFVLCHFMLIQGDGKNGFRYRTYERTNDLFKDGSESVISGWAADGTHQNFGSRKFDAAASFLAALGQLDAEQPKPSATSTPGS